MRDHRHQHAGQPRVDCITLLPTGLRLARQQRGRLADQLEVLRVLQRHVLGNRLLHRGIGEFAIAGTPAARADDEAFVRVKRGHVRLPPLGRRGQEHRAGAGAQLTVLRVRVLDAVGAASEVHAHRRIDVARVGAAERALHLAPIGVELLRRNDRQARLDALTHVHAVDRDGHGPVLTDGNEAVGLLRRLQAGRGRCRCLRCGPRQHAECEGRGARTAGKLEKATAVHAAVVDGASRSRNALHDGGVENHDALLAQANWPAASLTAARMR